MHEDATHTGDLVGEHDPAPSGRGAAGGLVGAVDLGGTHVTAGLVDVGTYRLVDGTVRTRPLSADGGRDELVDAIAAAMRDAGPRVTRWGLAVPGPFDYAEGIARFHGVGKFESLDGLDVRTALAERLGLDGTALVFRNDADAFLLGEWVAGSVRGRRRCVGLTFGTGVGSAFMVEGAIVESGPGVPPEGRVDLLEYEGRGIEETFSRRGLLRAYGSAPYEGFDVRDIIERAGAGERHARDVIERATGALGRVLTPWLTEFGPTALVVGGAISRGWQLLRPTLVAALSGVTSLRDVAPTHLGDAAPLLGAAHASDSDARA